MVCAWVGILATFSTPHSACVPKFFYLAILMRTDTPQLAYKHILVSQLFLHVEFLASGASFQKEVLYANSRSLCARREFPLFGDCLSCVDSDGMLGFIFWDN